MKKTIITFSLLISGSMIFAQQNLGVNQTTPTAKTHITNTENQHSLRVDDESGDASPFVVNQNGQVGVMNNTPQVSLDINASDAVNMPNGTTAQRPATPAQGAMRYNSEIKSMEFYDGTNWVSLTPAGSMQMFGGVQAQIPGGWLICDGTEVSRTDYLALFAAIGTNFGEGDGATTFHLPDMRGRFARGTDNGAGNDPDAGSRTESNTGGNTGDAVGSLQDDELKSHNHNVDPPNTSTTNNGNHNHQTSMWDGITQPFGSSGSTNSGNSASTSTSPLMHTSTNGDHSHDVNISPFNSASEGGSETRPKNVSVNYIIKY